MKIISLIGALVQPVGPHILNVGIDGIDGIDVSQLNEILANRSYVLRWQNDTLSIERRPIDVEISEIND